MGENSREGTWTESLARNTSPLDALKTLRHDLLNSLQLVRAYVQMNNPDKALAAVGAMSDWLQTIARCQTQLGDTCPNLVWTAVCCPRVKFDNADTAILWAADRIEAASGAWLRLDQIANEFGVNGASIRFVSNRLQEGVAVEVHVPLQAHRERLQQRLRQDVPVQRACSIVIAGADS